MYITLLLGFIYQFLQICEMGVREKVSVFDYWSGISQRILIHVLSMNCAVKMSMTFNTGGGGSAALRPLEITTVLSVLAWYKDFQQ